MPYKNGHSSPSRHGTPTSMSSFLVLISTLLIRTYLICGVPVCLPH
jgi:hypothetical protein